ncbi:MAG: FkbM family methyltransferase, partial [Pseudomonadota bacterium]|nr:FkbM family methyltransferase [Pseudomonadota bacterium]
MRRSLELQLKAILPRPISRLLRSADNYRKRLLLWRAIGREIKGIDPSDRRALRRALRAAPYASLRDPLNWQDPVLSEDATVDVEGVGRFRVRARSDDLYHALPSREPAVFAVIRDSLRPGDTFVDAGANIGIFSVLAARQVGASGRVVAVEMMPDTAAILTEHLAMNEVECATVVRKALSDKAGQTVTANVVEGHFGLASIAWSPRPSAKQVKVQTTTLDEVLADVDRIELIKMDLEGAELT